ncbi:DUF4153 domain-containing protein [Lagierella sp. ICN-221743]
MKKFLKKNFMNFENTLLRFPVSTFMGLVIGVLMCLVVDDYSFSDKLIRYVTTCLVGLFVFIFIEILNGKLNKKPTEISGMLSYVPGFVIVFLTYRLLGRTWDNEFSKNFIYFFGLCFFFISLSLIAEKYNNPTNHEFYVYRIIRSLFISTLLSFIVWLGVTLIIFSIFMLFGLRGMDEYILKAMALSLGTLNLWMFLNNFPSEAEEDSWEEPQFGLKILNNILIPIEIIFSLVLIAYFVKIIAQGVMPLRIVCYLALVYGILAFFIIFFSPERRKNSNVLIRFYLPCSSLVFLGLMYYTMGHRISNFGLTENRYYVILIGIYLTLFMIYNILCNRKSNVISIAMLALFILVSTIGPINSYNMSLNSQAKRFDKILERNNISSDSDISKLSRAEKNNLSSILNYFKYRDELGRLQENKKIDVTKLQGEASEENIYENLEIYHFSKLNSMDISTYNEMVEISSNKVNDFKVEVQCEKVIFSLNGEEITYDINELSDEIKKLNEEKPFELDFEKNENIKVFLTELSIEYDTATKDYGLGYFEGYIFK